MRTENLYQNLNIRKNNFYPTGAEVPTTKRKKMKTLSTNREKGATIYESLSDYVVIDLETTDVYVTTCSVIELSAIRVRNNEICETFSTLVNPEEKIPEEVTQLTGITDSMVKDAPTLSACLPAFLDFLGDDVLLGHNIVSFDVNILYDAAEGLFGKKIQNDCLDTLYYSRRCELNLPNYRLDTLQEYFGVINERQHRALADCKATHECYQKLKPLYSGILARQKQERSERRKLRFSETTQSLNELQALLQEMTFDQQLTKDEIYDLQQWVSDHQQLRGCFPFDIVFQELEQALEDGVLEQCELDHLLEIFCAVTDPVESFSEKEAEIDFCGKSVCLSGEFTQFATKAEVEKRLQKKGAIIKKNVVKSLDYLIVGGNGNENWSCGNYGSKVKRALELQEKGASIQILKEEEMLAHV